MKSTWHRKIVAPLAGAALTFVALLIPAPMSAQSGFRVVVHPDNPADSMTASELSRLFLKKVTAWPDGRRVEPVDQREGSGVRAAFSEAIHDREVTAIKAYWNKVIFSGRGLPPPELSGDQDVLDYVRSHPRSLGYVSPRADTTLVKILRIEP
jgi:ABC-type phosphate transport system substrate-binding protein